MGRFIGQDPLGFGAGDSNLYRYVGNGPISKVDPTGLQEVLIPELVRPKIIPEVVPEGVIPKAAPIPQPPAVYKLPNLTPEQQKLLDSPRYRRYRGALRQDDRGCISGYVQREPNRPNTTAYRYATQVSGTKFDYLVVTPQGIPANFDGRTAGTRQLWEAKYGYWIVPYPDNVLDDEARDTRDRYRSGIANQFDREISVASACRYDLNAAFSNNETAYWFKQNYGEITEGMGFQFKIVHIDYLGR